MSLSQEQLNQMAERFIRWPVPSSVSPDPCVMENKTYKEKWGHSLSGTNFFTYEEAKQMLAFCMAETDFDKAVQEMCTKIKSQQEEIEKLGEMVRLEKRRNQQLDDSNMVYMSHIKLVESRFNKLKAVTKEVQEWTGRMADKDIFIGFRLGFREVCSKLNKKLIEALN